MQVRQALLKITGYGMNGKQTMFAFALAPSTSVVVFAAIPPVEIMDCIVELVGEVSNALL